MESDLSLEFLRVTEQAAIACAHTMGQGDRHGSDQVAVEAMRREMDTVPIDGTIVIGEGERDEAPMLYIGEKVGLAATDRRPPANGYSDEYPVGRFYRNCKGAVIYEGTREIHKLMQADYLLGYRSDRPTRCELPPHRAEVKS